MDNKRKYEIILILSEEGSLEEIKKNVEAIFQKRDIEIQSKEDLGSRKLFHEARKQSKGFYQYFIFSASPDSIEQLNKDIGVSGDILKSFITRIA